MYYYGNAYTSPLTSHLFRALVQDRFSKAQVRFTTDLLIADRTQSKVDVYCQRIHISISIGITGNQSRCPTAIPSSRRRLSERVTAIRR